MCSCRVMKKSKSRWSCFDSSVRGSPPHGFHHVASEIQSVGVALHYGRTLVPIPTPRIVVVEDSHLYPAAELPGHPCNTI
jgi:hypothetical protein